MQAKTKLLIFTTLILVGLGLANLINIFLNFRQSSVNNAVEKSKMVAHIVKDGLTAHMVNGIMSQRRYFLNQISQNKEIKSLWIVRGDNVIKQHGVGLTDETAQDKMDIDVLKSGKLQKKLTETINDITLRVTIPYIATNKSDASNCLACHNVQKGDVLGAISMEFDISKMRTDGAISIFKILMINMLFVIIILFLVNYYVTPYTKLFINMQDGITKAYRGDFTHIFKTTINGDAKEIVNHLNILFSKMQENFGNIRHSLTVFTSKSSKFSDDPLSEANQIITELSDIYKFKKTIELDISKNVVFKRVVNVFKNKYGIQHFSIYMINDEKKTRESIYLDIGGSICNESTFQNALECRAYRTETDIISTDFYQLCQGCKKMDTLYSCFFYSINDDYSLVISMTAKDKDELKSINEKIPHLRNYLEAAKPVIESKLLMEKLRENSLKDGMTGLYNRRFLDEFISQFMHQANRNKDTYHIMMLDVDYFKKVNDTYGHDVGDKVIVAIGQLLIKSIRNSDLAIRYGGEEFVVMLHNSTDEGSMLVAKNIHSAFAATEFNVGQDEVIYKTMSIGIAKFPDHGDTIWECIKYADTALYEAKETGRNKIIRYENS